jgi:hypothetical protein
MQHSKLCSSKNWNAIYNQVNLRFCATSLKIILWFGRWSTRVSLEQCISHHPSIRNLFQEIRYFKSRAWELVMMSDCLKHDSILVHTFQGHLMKFTENTFESPLKKIVYFSDGSATQYKNRKIYYILHATMKTLEFQQSGTSLRHPMGSMLVMGLVTL